MQSTVPEGMEAPGAIGRPMSVFENWRAFCPVLHFIIDSVRRVRHTAHLILLMAGQGTVAERPKANGYVGIYRNT